EELLTEAEGTDATQHKRIFVAKRGALSQNDLTQQIVTIECMIHTGCLPSDVTNLLNALDQVRPQEGYGIKTSSAKECIAN
ncbi:MAG: hypothetical protein Q8N36_04650, partial [bacterium]|nr:hypothetical protein [bacterium]